MQHKKPIVWMGSSRGDLAAMPEEVKKDFGGALHGIQEGRTPSGAKALKGKAKGAMQIAENHRGDTYRTIYTTELEETVYILHCFQKKSKRGSATPQADLDLIARRLTDAKAHHASQRGMK